MPRVCQRGGRGAISGNEKKDKTHQGEGVAAGTGGGARRGAGTGGGGGEARDEEAREQEEARDEREQEQAENKRRGNRRQRRKRENKIQGRALQWLYILGALGSGRAEWQSGTFLESSHGWLCDASLTRRNTKSFLPPLAAVSSPITLFLQHDAAPSLLHLWEMPSPSSLLGCTLHPAWFWDAPAFSFLFVFLFFSLVPADHSHS